MAQVALKRRLVGGSRRRRRYSPQTTWSVVGGNAYIMRNVIHHVVYRRSPHHAPHSVQVLATSSSASFNIVPVLATSPGTGSLKFLEAPCAPTSDAYMYARSGRGLNLTTMDRTSLATRRTRSKSPTRAGSPTRAQQQHTLRNTHTTSKSSPKSVTHIWVICLFGPRRHLPSRATNHLTLSSPPSIAGNS